MISVYLTIGTIDEQFESYSQFGWQAFAPRFVQQLHVEHIAQMHPIFISKSGQLHAYQCVQAHRSMTLDLDRLRNVGVRQYIIGSYAFPSEHDMNRIPCFALDRVEKHVDIFDVSKHKASLFHRCDRSRPICSPQKNVDITRRANRGFVGLGHPSSHGISAHDRIRNSGLLQRRSRSLQSFLDLLHRSLHALP